MDYQQKNYNTPVCIEQNLMSFLDVLGKTIPIDIAKSIMNKLEEEGRIRYHDGSNKFEIYLTEDGTKQVTIETRFQAIPTGLKVVFHAKVYNINKSPKLLFSSETMAKSLVSSEYKKTNLAFRATSGFGVPQKILRGFQRRKLTL